MITQIGYSLSGLPDYGVDDDGVVYARSYMLYQGRTPREVRGEWEPTGNTVIRRFLNSMYACAARCYCADGLRSAYILQAREDIRTAEIEESRARNKKMEAMALLARLEARND